MKFGIRISTYRRDTGTFHLLSRCIRSIIAQTFTEWKVFLIGDQYEPTDEFQQLCNMIPSDKLYQYNLPFSPERNKYTGKQLWKVAGCTACCLGINKIKEESIPICACIDDDDWWENNHLETLWDAYQEFPDAAFIYTQSTYKSSNRKLPSELTELSYNNKPPKAYGLIHSAASWNVNLIPIIYRNTIDEPSPWVAGDADMWERIRKYCIDKNLKTLYVPKLTVHHDCEENKEYFEPMVI